MTGIFQKLSEACFVSCNRAAHLVRKVHEPDSDGYEGHADDEKGWQDGAGGEDGLPRGQSLLLEGAVLWLVLVVGLVTRLGYMYEHLLQEGVLTPLL